jgi:glycosyltransferase involved in cell wall biosynthesis
MKEGCPVLTSGNGSLREVGAEAVYYSDPSNFDKFTKDLEFLLTHPSVLIKLSELGTLRAKDFTWDKTAALTHEIYEKVLQNSRS